MSYHKFPSLSEHFQGVLSTKLSRYIYLADLRDNDPCNCPGGQCVLKGAEGQCKLRNVIYQITCGFCNQAYIGNTSQTLKARANGHLTETLRAFDPGGNVSNNGQRASSTTFATHYSSCWKAHHLPGASRPSRAQLRARCEFRILWRGKTLTCHRTMLDWDCRLCQQERIALVRARFIAPVRRFFGLINKHNELNGACRHRPRFHPLALTSGNTGADDPV